MTGSTHRQGGWEPGMIRRSSCGAGGSTFQPRISVPMASSDIIVSLPPDPDKVVEVWTDGGCRPNPGPGGWGAILTFRDVVKELSGVEAETTNNRMELTAAAEALESLKRPCHVIVHTDSQYLKNGITRWITGWVRKGWKSSVGDPVANIDLW